MPLGPYQEASGCGEEKAAARLPPGSLNQIHSKSQGDLHLVHRKAALRPPGRPKRGAAEATPSG